MDDNDGDGPPHNQSSSSPHNSQSTGVTTPDQSPGDDNDIWASDSDPDLDPDTTTTNTKTRSDPILSDLPTLRRQHVTDGYREGLAVGKAKVMQSGFDAGYPIGMAIASRAGIIIGVLEGYSASKDLDSSSVSASASVLAPDSMEKPSLVVQKLLERARDELSCTRLLANLSDDIVADATGIPKVVEDVLVKWEELVFGGAAGAGVGDGPNTASQS